MNMKNILQSICEKFFTFWKHLSLFTKSLLLSSCMTCIFFLLFILPFTRPDPLDLSQSFHPVLAEWFTMLWAAPVVVVGLLFMWTGFYPGNENAGVWGGIFSVALLNTFLWVCIFYVIFRLVRLLKKNISLLKKQYFFCKLFYDTFYLPSAVCRLQSAVFLLL